MHLDDYQGLGPGPAAQRARPARERSTGADAGAHDVASQLPGFVPGQRLGPLPGPAPGPLAPPPAQPDPQPWLPPWMQPPPTQAPQCAVFCIQDQPAPLQPALGAPADTNANPLIPPGPGPLAPALAPPPGPLAPGCLAPDRRPGRSQLWPGQCLPLWHLGPSRFCRRVRPLGRCPRLPRYRCPAHRRHRPVKDVPSSRPRLDGDVLTFPRPGIRGPRRTGQGDRPRAAAADHRARHGQERHRRAPTAGSTSRCI